MVATSTKIVSGRIPGELIAATTLTADSPTWTTTETTAISVTAALVDGRTYRVRLDAAFATDSAGDVADVKIRLTDTSGTTLQDRLVYMPITSSATGFGAVVEGLYTATSTGSVTFVGTGRRVGAGGTHRIEAASGRDARLEVFYLEG
jgi:hypothetical protein